MLETRDAVFSMDDHYPREPAHRYRIYRLRAGDREVLGTTPTAGGIGEGIVAWAEEGDLLDSDVLGVLDCQGDGENPLDEFGHYTHSGRWLVNPYAAAGRR